MGPPALFFAAVEDFFAAPRVNHFKAQLHADFSDRFPVALVVFHAQNGTRDEHFLFHGCSLSLA